MKKQTRRQFITTSVGTAVLTTVAGVAVASCATAEGVAGGTGAAVGGEAGLLNNLALSDLSGPVVAYVRNMESGEIALCVGEKEIVYSDKEFVSRLLKAVG